MKLKQYEIHSVHLPLPHPIGDSQVCFVDHRGTILELETDTGLRGVGFQVHQGMPTAALKELKEQFEFQTWPALLGANPFSVANRIERPRGGNVGASPFGLVVETALWDLMSKHLDLPLYRLLGGTRSRVRAYGSTLDFHLTDDEFRAKLIRFREQGFKAMKIKVGHPDVEWDLARMSIARQEMGPEPDLMIDSNEAWSPKEALLRLHRYRDEGFEIYWMEDPIDRHDLDGYRMLCSEIPFTRINTGEYLGFSGKRRLLEAAAVDVLNVHTSISESRTAARLAGDYGIPVSLGNTPLETGVHAAVSFPECLYMEFSDLMWNVLAQEPIRFEDGYAIAPDRPGHGLELDREALAHYSVPG